MKRYLINVDKSVDYYVDKEHALLKKAFNGKDIEVVTQAYRNYPAEKQTIVKDGQLIWDNNRTEWHYGVLGKPPINLNNTNISFTTDEPVETDVVRKIYKHLSVEQIVSGGRKSRKINKKGSKRMKHKKTINRRHRTKKRRS